MCLILSTRLGRTGRIRAKENKTAAKAHAAELAPMIQKLRAAGIMSISAIADALNKHNVKKPRGGRWHPTSVDRLLTRLP
jgi:hypothetical protein